jgi:hypothetical protein
VSEIRRRIPRGTGAQFEAKSAAPAGFYKSNPILPEPSTCGPQNEPICLVGEGRDNRIIAGQFEANFPGATGRIQFEANCATRSDNSNPFPAGSFENRQPVRSHLYIYSVVKDRWAGRVHGVGAQKRAGVVPECRRLVSWIQE